MSRLTSYTCEPILRHLPNTEYMHLCLCSCNANLRLTPWILFNHSSSFVHSLNLQDETPSSITNFIVEKTISSYSSRPAALALACHGPRPPNLASLRLRQMPIQRLVTDTTAGYFRFTYKSPGFVCVRSSSQTNTSAVHRWQ